jgi:hypothetical protein
MEMVRVNLKGARAYRIAGLEGREMEVIWRGNTVTKVLYRHKPNPRTYPWRGSEREFVFVNNEIEEVR